MFDSQPNI